MGPISPGGSAAPRYAVLFPGQGSQHVGMGRSLFATRTDLLVEAADAVLDWSLRDVCLEGPEDVLTATEHAQVALFGVSYVLWEEWAKAAPTPPLGAAGHSLGEYTALVAAGAVDFVDGLRLVAERGRAMADAAASEPSGMAALIGATPEQAETICAARRDAGGKLWVANLNAPGQVVVAGPVADIAWIADHARDLGIRRAIPLKVAGAFHSPLMEPAAARLAGCVGDIAISACSFPVWANLDAVPTADPAKALVGQLTGTVRFSESLESMARHGIEAFVHIGPGDVTAGMARRTVPGAAIHAVSDVDDIPTVIEALFVQ